MSLSLDGVALSLEQGGSSATRREGGGGDEGGGDGGGGPAPVDLIAEVAATGASGPTPPVDLDYLDSYNVGDTILGH